MPLYEHVFLARQDISQTQVDALTKEYSEVISEGGGRIGKVEYWGVILDSNVSSLITASILFLFGSSTIRGFGLVLIIGVLVSMFTAVTVTRTILRIIVQQPWARKASLYGVTEEEFLARPTSGRGSVRGEARTRV